jgi:hypothetical protein
MSLRGPAQQKRLIQFAELVGRDTTPDGEAMSALRAMRKALAAQGTSLARLLEVSAAREDVSANDYALLERKLETSLNKIANLNRVNARQKAFIEKLELMVVIMGDRIKSLEASQRGSIKAANTTRLQKADKHALMVRDILAALGPVSMAEAAATLNEREIPAPRGGQWSARQVRRVTERVQPPAGARST